MERRPPPPYYAFHSSHDTSFNAKFDRAEVDILKHKKNKSFRYRFKALFRKIAFVFAAFGSKSEGDVSEGEAYGEAKSSQISTNSSVFSSGSKIKESSSYRSSFESPKRAPGKVYGSLNFTLQDIQQATDNFSQENIIGEGGFGTVYKGQLRDRTFVAVKRAKKDLLDKRTLQEFRSEIRAFSKIEHLNLVKFYGYLEHSDENIIVVEYVGNGTLFKLLHGNQGSVVELGERLDIAIDVAHAVTYLHTYSDPPIIHRDIKASNVLITEKFRAKVADFGLARFVSDGPDATHIMTQVKGTIGYLDPEYMQTYQLTEKSDVYSFGVLLVELVTGRHPLEPRRGAKERMTTPWALKNLREGLPVVAMDPRLKRNPASIKAIEKILQLAQECTGANRQTRPSMKECAEALWAIRMEFKGGAQSDDFSSRKSVDLYEVDERKSRKHPGIKGDIYSYMSA